MAQAAPQEAPQQAPAVPPMPTGPTSFERVIGLPTQGNTQPQQGMNMQMLMEAANNPWLDDNTRQMVNSLIEREMQKQDPAYQMQQQAAQVGLDKSKLELQQMQNPAPAAPKFENVGGRLVQIMPDGTVKEAYSPPAEPSIPKPPTVDTFYDEKTGQPVKRQWNPETQNWENVGGAKAGSNGITITNPDGTTTVIGGTGGTKSTEGDRRAQLLAKQMVGSAEDALKNFDAMASIRDTVGSALNGVGGRALMSNEGQVSRDAMGNIVKNWLYLTSGATATDEEVKSQMQMIIPSALDGPDAIEAKRERMKSIVDTMRERAGLAPRAEATGKQKIVIDGFEIEEVD
jgi:hypothetical protein